MWKTEYIYIFFFYPTGSAIYGVAAAPNDFATYLLAILIVNGLLYLAFYVIMKVLPSSVLIYPSNLSKKFSDLEENNRQSLVSDDLRQWLSAKTEMYKNYCLLLSKLSMFILQLTVEPTRT